MFRDINSLLEHINIDYWHDIDYIVNDGSRLTAYAKDIESLLYIPISMNSRSIYKIRSSLGITKSPWEIISNRSRYCTFKTGGITVSYTGDYFLLTNNA